VAFSPDGAVIAAAGAGSAIQFWDVATRTPHGRPITGFPVAINDIAFTPDGRTIAAADDEGLRLWDVETGRARGASLQTATHAYGVAFGPDGDVVVAGGDDTTTVWDLHTEVLVSQACRIANRDLTRAEWDSFLPSGTPYAQTCPRS
jgi:WD40 repeat protein